MIPNFTAVDFTAVTFRLITKWSIEWKMQSFYPYIKKFFGNRQKPFSLYIKSVSTTVFSTPAGMWR